MSLPSTLYEASAWSMIASNTTLLPEHRLDAAIEAIRIYEDYMDKRTRTAEHAVKYVLDNTRTDTLVTRKQADELFAEIMLALSDAGLID